MSTINQSTFSKYEKRGAYHWAHLGRNLRQHNCFTAARYKVVLDMLGDCHKKRVLDVGCGDGALTALIVQKGALVTGCEPEPTGRRLAGEMFGASGQKADFVTSIDDVPDETFDAVVMAEVIEHLPEPSRELKLLQRVLKPGGFCVISTPIRLTEQPADREHVKEFWTSELARLVSRHFTIQEHRRDLPIFWLECYYWRPLGLPIPKLVMNLLSAWFGIQLLRRRCPQDRYYTLQCIVGHKPAQLAD